MQNPALCFYFQVHQPLRLKEYTFFEIGKDHLYEDDKVNSEIFKRVAQKCYLPSNDLIKQLINEYNGKFKVSYSISGVFLEQCERFMPEVLASFQELAKTGCVEFLGETYYHSLSSVFSLNEFRFQVKKHSETMKHYFDATPKVFRNTELIFHDKLANEIFNLGFEGVITEGIDKILEKRTPNFVYQSFGNKNLKMLLKNYKLSDDLAFRFGDFAKKNKKITAESLLNKINKLEGDVINFFIDYETFGEHQWADTGIFDFIKQLPKETLKKNSFVTPFEAISNFKYENIYKCSEFISWADQERDLTAWLGNSMQKEASNLLYNLENKVLQSKNQGFIDLWRHLQTSDHLYYMCTKNADDGDVHQYFNPYKSPYNAYIYFMNVLADFEYCLEN